MLEIQSLSYRIKDKHLLQDISATFKPGEISIILGANGAGKSTLMQSIAGLIRPTAGEVLFDKQLLREIPLHEMATKRAVLSQENELAFPLLVNEVVMIGRYPHFESRPNKIDHDICDQAMELFGISKFKDRNFLSLSGGEKQRVHFARITAQILPKTDELKLLLLDEPLTFLDIQYQLLFMGRLKEVLLHKNLIVIGVLHDLNLALKYADQVLLLREGKSLAFGKTEAVLNNNNIQKAFGVTAEIITNAKGQKQLLF